MAYRFPFLSFFILSLNFFAFPHHALAGGGFHPPLTEAERVLDGMIKRAQSEEAMAKYLLRSQGTYNVLGDDYGKLYTPGLMQAWSETEASMVYSNCGGDYRTGQTCGIDYNPVTCSNFKYDEYHYRTDADADPNSAVIAYRLPEGRQIIATYYLVKRDGAWKLDGIDCGLGNDFNL
jgi:hypothetical protein